MASTFACHFPNGEAANSSGGSGYPGPQSTRPRTGRPPGMMTPRGGGGNESHTAGEAGSLGGGAGIGEWAGEDGDESLGLCGVPLDGSKATGDGRGIEERGVEAFIARFAAARRRMYSR